MAQQNLREKELNTPINAQLRALKSDSDPATVSPSRNERKAEIEKRKKNRMIANIMIYSGVVILVILCVVVCITLFVSQNNNNITSIKFTPDKIEIKAGYSEKLKIVTEPAGVEYAITFSSSDSSIASVSNDGTVTCHKAGTTVIKATSSQLSAECTVTVKADVIEQLTLDTYTLTLGGGQEKTIKLTATPDSAKDKNIIWKSSDENIAIVDADGKVKGVNLGEVKITVTDTVTGLSKAVDVTVTGLELPNSMSFAKDSIILEVGEVYTAELIFSPDNITDKSAIYYTDDKEIASVTNEGVITAKSVGTVTIEAYYENDNSLVATMEVTVIEPFVISSKPDDTTTPKPDNSAPPYTEGIEVIDGNTYVNGILIANKTYALSPDYNYGVDDTAYNALYELEDGAAADGYVIFLLSGFRDYETQEAIYNQYVANDGQANADRYSARPGHSEHQTGLAFDVNSLDESFGETPEGIWLAKNCYKYGFIIRYPKGKEHITGYMYEPWHIRYLGVDIATKVYNSGLTLEEYLGITSEYQY